MKTKTERETSEDRGREEEEASNTVTGKTNVVGEIDNVSPKRGSLCAQRVGQCC